MSKQQKNSDKKNQSYGKNSLIDLNSKIARQAQSTKPPNYTLQEAKESYKNRDHLYQEALKNVDQKSRLRQYDATVGRKMRKTILEELKIPLSEITIQDQKALDYLLIEDDFVEGIKKFAATAGKYLKPFVKPMVQQFAPALMPLVSNYFNESTDPTVNRGEGIRVKRRYLLRTVNQQVEGYVQSISVNPGLADFGQWLAIVGKAYQFYEIHSLTFEYVSSTALTTAGTISYYMEMDGNAPAPGINDIGQQYKSTTHAMYQNSQVTYVHSEIHQLVKRLHVRNEGIAPEEISIYDAGRLFYICSSTTSAAAGQFFVDIDLSFHVPTLQGLTNEIVSQSILSGSLQNLILPVTTLFPISPGDTRLIGGFTMEAYKIVKTGTLYGLFIGSGTNGVTVGRVGMQTSTNNTSSLTLASNQSSRNATTSGAQVIAVWWTLNVQAGNLLYLAKMDNNEALNNFNSIHLTYDPRAFPYNTILEHNGRKAESALRDQQFLQMQQRESELRTKLEKQQKAISYLMNKQQLQPIQNETSFEFD